MPNFPYYVVVLGHSPGVYNNWDECQLAIGEMNPPPPRPKPFFRGKNSLKEADTYFEEMREALRRISEAAKKFQNDLDEIRDDARIQRKRALETDNQLQKTIAKVARLENLLQQTNPLLFELENAVDEDMRDCIKRKRLCSSLMIIDNPFKLQLQESGYCSVSVICEIGDDPEKAEFKVDFGTDSPLSKTFRWFKGVKCTECNGEIQAALVALLIAKEAGIKKLKIESQSTLLKLVRNNDSDLLRMLNAAVDALDDVQWVPKEIETETITFKSLH